MPHLVYSEYCSHKKTVDSDIQYDFSSLTIPPQNRLDFYKDYPGVEISQEKSADKPFTKISDKFVLYKTPETFIDRVKKSSKYSVDDALLFKNMPITVSMSEIPISSNPRFPFDEIGEDFSKISEFLLKSLVSNDLALELQKSHPEICLDLYRLYFRNFYRTVKSQLKMLFIVYTKTKTSLEQEIYSFLDKIILHNPNVKILAINSVQNIEERYKKYFIVENIDNPENVPRLVWKHQKF